MSRIFGSLDSIRDKPIPSLATRRKLRKPDDGPDYRSHQIDQAHSLFEEPAIDVRNLGLQGENFYHREDNAPYYHRVPGSISGLWLRETVAKKLLDVDSRLRAEGLRLHVHDAYRPTAVQSYFFDQWMPAEIRKKHPDWTAEQVMTETMKFWAKPTAPGDSPSPHSTGAAVDLTIYVERTSEPLYMGSIFDDVTAVALTDYLERPLNDHVSYSEMEAGKNRRLLYWVMETSGLINNPNEWWHFSWGDQMWARLSGAVAAVYGSIEEKIPA